MAADKENTSSNTTRLLSCYLPAGDNGLHSNSIMLCEVLGDEIQTVALRVAADAMTQWNTPYKA